MSQLEGSASSGRFAIAESSLFWDQLLQLIEDGRVVPIVGRDLLTVRVGDREGLLYPLLGERLAEYLGVSAEDLPAGGELNAVACRFLDQGNRLDQLYSALKTVMPDDDELSIPEPLLQLAEIPPLQLFVTTTFDSLLQRALGQVRQAQSRILAYAPNEVTDLPAGIEELDRPVVYHLLGKLSAVPAYAVTQEDLLEFVHSLQSETKQPQLLFDELSRRSLLILGSSFEGWLARFFLRTAKRPRLMDRHHADYVVDDQIQQDASLALFLEHFASGTQIYRSGGACEFVTELHRRWHERHPAVGGVTGVDAAKPPAATTPPNGAVFLSYASEDRAAAERIKQALEEVGVDVFFDKDDLRAGDDFELRLLRAIVQSSLFVPLISCHTVTGSRRFFRLEWTQALDEARKAAPSEAFIVPVAIDDTSEKEEVLPERFRKLHWHRLPGGDPTPEFVDLVRGLFRRHKKLASGAA